MNDKKVDNLIKRGQWGYFKLSSTYRDTLTDVNIQLIFKDFIPSHTAHNLYQNQISWFGWHPTWKEIGEGAVAPEYMIFFDKDPEDNIISYWKQT